MCVNVLYKIELLYTFYRYFNGEKSYGTSNEQLQRFCLGNLIKMQILWSISRDSDLGGLEWDLSVFVFSNRHRCF